MNSYMPRLRDYPISNSDTRSRRRNTPREMSIQQAAERWALRSRMRRS